MYFILNVTFIPIKLGKPLDDQSTALINLFNKHANDQYRWHTV